MDKRLKKTIEVLNENEQREFIIDSPKDWNFLIFTGIEKPNSCGEKCACICNSVWIKSQTGKCDEANNGICVPIQSLQSEDLKIKIQSSLTKIFLAKSNVGIIVSESPITEETASASSQTS